jgi:hypothetical protein
MAAAADRCLASSAVDAIDRLIARIGFENLAQSLRHQILSWYTELGALDKAYVVANDILDHLGRHGIVGMTWSGLWLREMRAFRRDRRFEPFAARPGLTDLESLRAGRRVPFKLRPSPQPLPAPLRSTTGASET